MIKRIAGFARVCAKSIRLAGSVWHLRIGVEKVGEPAAVPRTLCRYKGDLEVVDLEEVQKMVLALPETHAGINEGGQFAAEVAGKGFAWNWMERITPKKPRVPCLDVLAVRVADLMEKEALLASDDQTFFTEPHYNGFPAVLVRLKEVEPEELRHLLTEAWRVRAPKRLVKEAGL